MSNSDSWCSPPEIADPLEEFFSGPVDVDPCSNSYSVIRARRAYTSGGLVLPWGLTTYENFPFSQGGIWTAKMLAEVESGNVRELVRLSMMSTSTHWWAAQCTRPKRNPRILCLKRLSFLDPFANKPGQRRTTAHFEPALTYIGPRTAAFTKAFAHLTRWSTWGRS